METCGQVDTRVAVGRGELMPLHASAAGKAVLAFLPRKEEERILQGLALEPYTPHTLRSAAALRKDLAEIRKLGIATNLQEFHNGINALAARSSTTKAAPWARSPWWGPPSTWIPAQLDEYAPLFVEAAAGITERIGGAYPPQMLEYWEQPGKRLKRPRPRSSRPFSAGRRTPAPA